MLSRLSHLAAEVKTYRETFRLEDYTPGGNLLYFLFTSYFILPLNEAIGNIMPGRGNVAIALAYLEAALSQVP